jgi:3-hydroxybutyrate dehydrogenase
MKDKIIVVTGSTSGIGLGIASKFAKNGAKLVINGLASDTEVKELSKNSWRSRGII